METKKVYQIVKVVLLVLTLLFSAGGCESELVKSTELTESAEQTQSSNETALAGSEAEELGVKIERNIPVKMRDGTILRADVHRPDRGGPYPVLLQRTVYGKSRNFDRFVKAGYIVVSQDVRGRYESEGKWETMIRLKTHDREDGYDTVEWAARLPDSTGKVGTFGGSYLGFLQWQLASLRPPSLVVMSANHAPARPTYHRRNGTIRPAAVRVWVIGYTPDMRRRANRPGVHTNWEAIRLWNEGESEKWFNFLPRLEMPKEVFEDETEVVKDYMGNPHFEQYRLDESCKEVSVPNLEFSGWYDMSSGDMLLFRTMVKEAKTETARKGSRIIIGPWTHGRYESRYGNIDFGSDAALDKTAAQIRLFDYWLKDIQNGVDKDAQVRIFVMGDNKWRDEQHWPLQGTKEKILFITSNGQANTPSGNGKLVEKEPASSDTDRYTYDPKDPVSSSKLRGPSDQRRLANRQDILVYQTESLTERIEVTGSPVVELYASSSAPDTDWFVRLIDVAPDGLARDVSFGAVCARYRLGLDKPKLIQPGEVIKYTIRMRPTSNAFLSGHRIRLDITSSDFPNYAYNHNTAANQNADAVLAIANQTIYNGGERATRIILPWVPNTPEREKPIEEEKPEPELERQTYPLHQATADGRIEQVKLLLSEGGDINAQDEETKTPLHYAAQAGKIEVVQLLVEAGADVNAMGGKYDRPPLYTAVEEDNIAIAEYLIAHGADVNSGRPLEDAPYYSGTEMVQLLIAKGADINAGPWTALHSAVDEESRDIVELLVQKGADVNAKNNRGRTPLHLTCNVNSIEMLELLSAEGTNINIKDNEGTTPLHIAARRGHRDVAEVLIAKGADINTKDNRGRTPLYRAASANRIETVELLISEGADINAKANNGMTPVSDALFSNRKDIAGLLIAKGGDFNFKNDRGLTALHNAAVEGVPDVAELLLAKGAKVEEKDDEYEFTALHYAARFGRKNVAEVLIANGADIKAKDKWDYQPIHWATHHDRMDIVELLISKGADINAKTSLGQTPLQLAEERRNAKTVELLHRHGARE